MKRSVPQPAIPRTVWMLGFVSLFMDMSSELVHSLLPIFLVSTLGTSMITVGLIEGVAEATALISKVFAGAISDFFGRRKGLILLGYGMAALTKPLFPLANSAETVFVARFLDRIGKGIRGAPRDALVADVAPPAIRGACFGLRQSMDTVGAFLGPMLAIILMVLFAGNIKAVLWFAVLPAILTIVLIVLGVEEKGEKLPRSHARSPICLTALKKLSRDYWWVTTIGVIFTLARFSEAFLILRALQVGFDVAWAPSVLITMSLAYLLSAYPAGILSDRIGRPSLLGAGLLLLIAADILLAAANSTLIVLLGVSLWGLHMGFTQGIFSAMIADVTPPELKGTSFGIFNLACGAFMLVASILAGELWDRFGAASTFYAGAAFALCALILLGSFRKRQQLKIFR